MADNNSNEILYVHDCPVLASYNGTSTVYKSVNLFSHSIYYIQNQIPETEQEDGRRDKCKCLLFLHTLPFTYNIKDEFTCFNRKNPIGGIETIPYGYLLFLGGILWRKKYIEKNHKDPILYKEGNDLCYLYPENDCVLLCENDKDTYSFFITSGIGGVDTDYNKLDNFLKVNNDSVIENKLLELFEEFVNNGFQEVKRCCELKKIVNNRETDLTGTDIKTIINELTSLKDLERITTIGDVTNALMGGMQFGTQKFTLSNFRNNYKFGYIAFDLLFTYFTDENMISNIYKLIYDNEYLLVTIPSMDSNPNGIKKNTLKNYFQGFNEMLTACGKIIVEQQAIDEKVDVEDKDVRDFKCEIYHTLKNIWDRWLCNYYNSKAGNSLNMFNVENFFDNNFVFIDSFYNNIYDVLKLNCKVLYDFYNNQDNVQTYLGRSTISYLGGVAAKHMCMLFNFPDNVNFAEIDRRGVNKEINMVQNMKDIFTPLPQNQVCDAEDANKFTVVYTHGANKLDTVDRTNFIHDSFDIWSFEEGIGAAPSIFKYNDNEYDMVRLTSNARMGYKVPAFGVAYSRQNNSLWKNIQITMDNFSVTEQVVRAEAYIANKGNSERHNITFYGQDIYSVYQAYSYLVTIEMMGDAQIQPLMYFQLMNVPMFRGTYMIIKVEHRITPGNMTTTFTGMKMSKVQTPYTKEWVAKASKYKSVPPKPGMDESVNGKQIQAIDKNGNQIMIDIEDDKLSDAIVQNLGKNKYCDTFVTNVYATLKNSKKLKKVKGELITGDLVYHRENENTPNMLQLLEKDTKNWTVTLFSPVITNFTFANMVMGDRSVGGNVRPVVGDLLFGYHDNKVSSKTSVKPDHVAIYLGYHGDTQYVAEGLSRTGNKIYNQTDGIQVIALSRSRLSLESDSIVWFANCKSLNINQTSTSSSYQNRVEIPNTNTTSNTNTSNIIPFVGGDGLPIVDSEEITPFTINGPNMGASFELVGNKLSRAALDNGGDSIQLFSGGVYTGECHVSSNTIITNLKNLVNNVLLPIYKSFPSIKWHLTSGYRCQKYNNSIKGASKTSDHRLGRASDFEVLGNQYPDNYNFARSIISELIIARGMVFDQFIVYPPASIRPINNIDKVKECLDKQKIDFMHISYRVNDNNTENKDLVNRGNFLIANASGKYFTISGNDRNEKLKYIFNLQ